MSKYHAIPTEVDGIVFHSKREASRYQELRLLERAGYLKDIEIQPKFPLIVNGKLVCNYLADFRYTTKDGKTVVEDVKGVKTPAYRIKAKLLFALQGIRVEDI